MAHWRNTWKPARFFMMDARAGIPLLGASLYIRTWTLLLAAGIVFGFWWMERQGMTFPSAVRAIRCKLTGKLRPAKRRKKIRHPVDYGRRPL